MPVTWLVWLALLVTAMSAHAGSARIELEVAGGVVAEAEYWPGEAGKPAVLLLHGFLATREFSTVRRLAEALADDGFSVLTPTLTLGLHRRRQSVACEALHTHSMEQDVAELVAWSQWLAEHAGKAPVVVGHSAGGVQLAALLDSHRDLAIDRAILISLSYFGEEQGPDQLAFLRARAGEDQKRRPMAMLPYALTYCTTYITTPGNILTYLNWDKERVEQALIGSSVPVTVIYGGNDERIDRPWVETLRSGGVEVRAVPGANHFFDLAYEFDLLDEVLRSLNGDSNG